LKVIEINELSLVHTSCNSWTNFLLDARAYNPAFAGWIR
jgi:hypothetical protein